jgi:hypothetical protein
MIVSTDLASRWFQRTRRGPRAMICWLFAVVATAFVELAALIAVALWTLDDLSDITLGVGGAVALAAATIIAAWSGVRLIGAVLRGARRRADGLPRTADTEVSPEDRDGRWAA